MGAIVDVDRWGATLVHNICDGVREITLNAFREQKVFGALSVAFGLEGFHSG